MKKSVKSLLLALMVLCLSATAVFADTLKGDHASADIYVDITTEVKSVDISPAELMFASTDVASLGTTAANSFASVDKKITDDIPTVSISYDKGVTTPVKLTVALSTDVTMDATIDKMYVALSKDATTDQAQSITVTDGAGEINITEASNDWYVLVGLDISDDVGKSAKGAVLFQLKVWSYDLTPKETGDKKAFESATFKLETDVTNGITPTTFEAKVGTTSKDFTISSDVTLISVDVTSSSDVLSFSKSGIIDAVTSNESNDKFALTVKVTSTVTSGSVTFKMASGDKESVDITLNFATSSSGSSEKTVEDVTSLDQTALGILSKDLESIGTDIVTYVTALTDFIPEENAVITAVHETTSGVVVLTVTAGSNTYTAIPAVNGTIPVLVSNGVMSLPENLTPAKLAAELKKITGSSELSDSDVTSFYTTVFAESFLENTTPKDPSEYGAEDPLLGGVSSFKATITNSLPYGTIILVYLKPFDADSTSTTKYGAMVHSGTPGEESKDINFDLDDVQDTSGSAISAISIPYTEEYTIGYSTPNGGDAFGGGSVEDGSVEIADATDGERGLFSEVELTGAAKKTVDGSNKGSSSGCDAGFGALALLAIVPFIRKIRK